VTVIVADGGPLPVDTLAWVALVLPLAYLAFGAARKQLQPPAILVLQLTALLFYIGLTTVALSVGDDIARYLVGFGWIAHAIWDGAHYRANRWSHAHGRSGVASSTCFSVARSSSSDSGGVN
jgi:hypothetical protein